MAYDFTWKNPSPEQIALNIMFSNKIKPKRMSTLQCADFVATAPTSMWYYEIRRYADGVYPLDIAKDSNRFFLEGCNNICKLVESGYNEEHHSWWRVEKPEGEEATKAANRFIIAIANALNTLKMTYVRQPLMVEMFECLAEIILGNDWERDFNNLPALKQKNNGRSKNATRKPAHKD